MLIVATSVYGRDSLSTSVLSHLVTACSKVRKVLFLALSDFFILFVNQIPREPLNGFAPNSQGRRV